MSLIDADGWDELCTPEEEKIVKRGRGRPKKDGGHDHRIDVRLASYEWDMLNDLEEYCYKNKKSRSEIMRIALRTMYFSEQKR